MIRDTKKNSRDTTRLSLLKTRDHTWILCLEMVAMISKLYPEYLGLDDIIGVGVVG